MQAQGHQWVLVTEVASAEAGAEVGEVIEEAEAAEGTHALFLSRVEHCADIAEPSDKLVLFSLRL